MTNDKKNIPCEYNQITKNIFIGTNKCCQQKFAQKLIKKGVSADISLEAERVDTPFGADFFIWIPVIDGFPPTLEEIEFAVNVINKLTKMNKKIYIHCEYGHGRSPTLVAAYFISQGMNAKSAVEKIKKKRPSIKLVEPQLKALEEYDQKVNNKPNEKNN